VGGFPPRLSACPVLKEDRMKRVIVLFYLIIACTTFAGDLLPLVKFADPMVWADDDFMILGSGIDSYYGDTVVYEAAIKNDGALIDILEITIVITDETGFPHFQIKFTDIDVPSGTMILQSSAFSLTEYKKALTEAPTGTRTWTVSIDRF